MNSWQIPCGESEELDEKLYTHIKLPTTQKLLLLSWYYILKTVQKPSTISTVYPSDSVEWIFTKVIEEESLHFGTEICFIR